MTDNGITHLPGASSAIIRLPPVLPRYPASFEFLAETAKTDFDMAQMAHMAKMAQFAQAQMAQMAQMAQVAQMAQMVATGSRMITAGRNTGFQVQNCANLVQRSLPSISSTILPCHSTAISNQVSLKRQYPDSYATVQGVTDPQVISAPLNSVECRPVQTKIKRSRRSMCEDCHQTVPSYGLKSDGKMRWCAGCAKTQHTEAERLTKDTVCEDCRLKVPSYGLQTEVRRRWCAGCAKTRPGSEKKTKRLKCEDCEKTVPSYGLRTDGKLRWCVSCAKAKHPQAQRLAKDTTCEDCKGKAPSYGLPNESRRRWCAHCARTKHPTAVSMTKTRTCEDCRSKVPSYGMRTDGQLTRRWCASCAKSSHPGSESWHKQQAVNKTKALAARTAQMPTMQGPLSRIAALNVNPRFMQLRDQYLSSLK